MKRGLLISISLAGACVAGVACGQLIHRSSHFRDAIEIWCGRGHLLAVVRGEGIYETDLRRALAELRYARGTEDQDRHEEDRERVNKVTNVTTLQVDERLVLTRLISDRSVRSLAAHEKVRTAKIDSELNLLRWQFRDKKAWRTALRASGLSIGSLRGNIANDLRSQQWITRRIAPRIDATEDECLNFYNKHLESFVQPARFRASHLFLAAPPETPSDVIETKQQAIKSFAERIKRGEKLVDLATIESEDEATKTRGGDLGFFSEARMPADFFAAVAKMRVGEISQPIRTQLGFHIIELTDSKPARQMTFEEARSEIRLMIENEKRRAALQRLAADLGRAEFVSNRLKRHTGGSTNFCIACQRFCPQF